MPFFTCVAPAPFFTPPISKAWKQSANTASKRFEIIIFFFDCVAHGRHAARRYWNKQRARFDLVFEM